jgi:AcrR family transcriptional regulator
MGRKKTASDFEVLMATIRAMGKHGPATMTLADIADEVGLSPATLLQRFGSKQGLRLAIAEMNRDAIEVLFENAERVSRSYLGGLRRGLARLVEPVETPVMMANNLAFLGVDLADRELRDHAVRQSREIRKQIARLLRAAVAAGELPPVDVDDVTEDIYTSFTGSLVTWAIEGRGRLTNWSRRHVDRVLARHFSSL